MARKPHEAGSGDEALAAALIDPTAIAVVGASRDPSSQFGRPVRYLTDYGFPGEVFPVNPKGGEMSGRRCYETLAELPRSVDLVVMLVSAEVTIRLLPEVAAAGATAAVVCGAGFGEATEGGGALEEQLITSARELGVRIIGPNCQGIAFAPTNLFATFTGALEHGVPARGDVAYIGQSGAVGGALLSLANEQGLGICAWASTGNQVDITAVELAQIYVERDEVGIIAIYLESAVDGKDYLSLLTRAADLGKPVVLLRGGRSTAGAKAVASHTGSMVGQWATFDAVSNQYGVVQADDITDFVAIIHGLSALPRAPRGAVGVVTTSGAAGSVAADHLERVGLGVRPFTSRTMESLSQVVPSIGSIANPVDVTAALFHRGGPRDFGTACRLVLDDSGVASLLVVLTLVVGEDALELAEVVSSVQQASSKPVVVVWLAARSQTQLARDLFRSRGLPIAGSIREGAQVLEALALPEPRPDSEPAVASSRDQGAEGLGQLVHEFIKGRPQGDVTEHEAMGLLRSVGISQPSGSLARDSGQAEAIARRLGDGPVVMKTQAPGLVHKSDVGAVHVGVQHESVESVFTELMQVPDTEPFGVLVQELVPDGPELVVGVTNLEAGFPPLVSVGSGGIAAELYEDIVTALAPVSERQAEELVRQLKLAPLLEGFRGQDGYALNELARTIALLSRLGAEFGERLVEFEVNPLRILESGRRVLALDFFLRLAPED